MSSTSKMLLILDLFTDEKVRISIEDVIQHLQISVPTGYRYLKELCEVGLLAKVESNSYILGPKIIKLDYQIKKLDPIIRIGTPFLKELVQLVGGEALLSNIYNDEIINVYSEKSPDFNYELTYNRGRPHPIYKGATTKMIVSHLPKSKIRKIYDTYETKIIGENIASNWEEYYQQLSTFKKQEFAVAYGELDNSLVGVAAPVFINNQIMGAITLVIPEYRLVILNLEKIIQFVIISAKEISYLIDKQEG